MRIHSVLVLSLLVLFGGGLAGCGESVDEPVNAVAVAAPLSVGRAAFEIAGDLELPVAAPADLPGLVNVYRLSENIVSGAEPQGEEAFAALAELGIKSIVTVDGKVPDAAAAAKYGIRYVHVPIQYSTITSGERTRIAKAFREMEGPFYVHCFHGKHRGPAAAAVGRLVLDGAKRERAVAEMRQWCGSSVKYGGLYEVVARGEMPTELETSALEWDFPAAHAFKGFRHAMVRSARVFDNLALLEKRGWAVDPEHPDVDPRNEAEKLVDAIDGSLASDEVEGRPEDFQRWLDESASSARDLVSAVEEFQAGDAAAADRAGQAFSIVRDRCKQCHAAYRNR